MNVRRLITISYSRKFKEFVFWGVDEFHSQRRQSLSQGSLHPTSLFPHQQRNLKPSYCTLEWNIQLFNGYSKQSHGT